MAFSEEDKTVIKCLHQTKNFRAKCFPRDHKLGTKLLISYNLHFSLQAARYKSCGLQNMRNNACKGLQKKKIRNFDKLCQCIRQAWYELDQRIIDIAISQRQVHLIACIETERGLVSTDYSLMHQT